MKSRKKIKWVIIVLVIVAVIIGIVGGITMFKNYVNINGQHLKAYKYSSGGGMTGGYRREVVKKYGDKAIICLESAEWHFQDPTVTEYLVDVAILDELEEIIRKGKMNFWHGKKFTNMFVSDGESESYSFDFDKSYINFSSQIYPEPYSKKLNELNKVVKKYLENGQRLPGLVSLEKDEDGNTIVPKDQLTIYASSYVDDTLKLRICNETDEDVELASKYLLTSADTGALVAEGEILYGCEFYKHSKSDRDIRLKERLLAGSYKITIGDLAILFEIK